MSGARLGLAVASVLGLMGCINLGEGTPPTRYYLLEALDASGGGAGDRRREWDDNLSVGVGPLGIPSGIDRPQIVTRTGPREVLLADFDRWAEPLGSAVARTLSTNLTALLGSDSVYSLDSPIRARPSFQVPVEVVRFDGALKKEAVLEALWAVESADASPESPATRVKRSSLRVAVDGDGYDALVDAMSRCLADLSREIADELVRVSSQGSS